MNNAALFRTERSGVCRRQRKGQRMNTPNNVSSCGRLVNCLVKGATRQGDQSLEKDVAAQEKDVCGRERNGLRAYLVVGGERRDNGRTRVNRKKGSKLVEQQEQTINEGRSASVAIGCGCRGKDSQSRCDKEERQKRWKTRLNVVSRSRQQMKHVARQAMHHSHLPKWHGSRRCHQPSRALY